MLNRLPEFVDPLLLVDKCQGFTGYIALDKMQRLTPLLADSAGEAQLEIQFGRDSVGFAIATGKVVADLKLRCQRCLELMDYRVDSQFVLGVVASLAETRNLPENYEPLIADQGPLSLAELVEDEILLALPAIAMHSEDCSAMHVNDSLYNASQTQPSVAQEQGRQNPFAVLAGLKGKLNK